MIFKFFSKPYLYNKYDEDKNNILTSVKKFFFEDKESIVEPLNQSSDGSDSEPSADNLDEDELRKLLPSKNKKKSKTMYFYFF